MTARISAPFSASPPPSGVPDLPGSEAAIISLPSDTNNDSRPAFLCFTAARRCSSMAISPIAPDDSISATTSRIMDWFTSTVIVVEPSSTARFRTALMASIRPATNSIAMTRICAARLTRFRGMSIPESIVHIAPED